MKTTEDNIMTLHCSHGALNSNKANIQEQGLLASEGSLGKAVYFWTINNMFLDRLSKYWVISQKSKDLKDDKKILIISFEHVFLKEDILDLSSADVMIKYNEYISKIYSLERYLSLSDQDKKNLYTSFIGEFDVPKALLTRHWLPKSKNLDFPLEELGSPFVLAIKSENLLQDLKKKFSFKSVEIN